MVPAPPQDVGFGGVTSVTSSWGAAKCVVGADPTLGQGVHVFGRRLVSRRPAFLMHVAVVHVQTEPVATTVTSKVRLDARPQRGSCRANVETLLEVVAPGVVHAGGEGRAGELTKRMSG